MIMHDVPLHSKEAGIREVFLSTKASKPRRVRGVSWTLGGMNLAAWKIQGRGDLLIGAVIDELTPRTISSRMMSCSQVSTFDSSLYPTSAARGLERKLIPVHHLHGCHADKVPHLGTHSSSFPRGKHLVTRWQPPKLLAKVFSMSHHSKKTRCALHALQSCKLIAPHGGLDRAKFFSGVLDRLHNGCCNACSLTSGRLSRGRQGECARFFFAGLTASWI